MRLEVDSYSLTVVSIHLFFFITCFLAECVVPVSGVNPEENLNHCYVLWSAVLFKDYFDTRLSCFDKEYRQGCDGFCKGL